MFDGKALGEHLTVVVRDFVARGMAGLSARMDLLAEQIKAIPAGAQGERGAAGEKGMDGAPGTAGRDGRDGKDGQDGKSVGIEDVSLLVRAAVAEIPAPVNGKDGAPGPAGERGEKGEPGTAGARGMDGGAGPAGPPGETGKAAEVDYQRIMTDVAAQTKALVETGVAAAVADIPTPQPGKDGADGKDGAPGLNGKDADPEFVRAEIALAVKALPPAKDGRDGRDAAPVDFDAVVKAVLAQVPAPVDGRDGVPGERGTDGANGRDGEHGLPGADGKSITLEDVRGILEAESARFQLEFERRAADVLQRAIDRAPAPKDGKDGFGLEQLAAELDQDGRTVRFRFVGSDKVNEQSIRFDVMIYRGVWKQVRYIRGDTVTYGGSLYHANKDTDEKPGNGSGDWTLCAKRGADAK